MKKIRLFSLFLTLVMTLTLFVGCSQSEPKPNQQTEEVIENTYKDLPSSLTAEKIGSVPHSQIENTSNHGIYYKGKNEKYGIFSLDGKNDTGPIYSTCELKGNNEIAYFQVSVSQAELDFDNLSTINCLSLVDTNGKELVPPKYASFEVYNNRYVKAIKATTKTTNEEDSLLRFPVDVSSYFAYEGDTFFKGQWVIYDVITGKAMEGATGTNNYTVETYGNILRYITDSGEQITINDKGQTIPKDAKVFDNGYYRLDNADGNGGVLYNSDNQKVFDYDQDDFIPQKSDSGYIVARKDTEGTKYVLMNTNGKIISGEFNDVPGVRGILVHAGEKICNFEGDCIIEGTYEDCGMDEQLGNVWFLRNDKTYTLIKKDGTVLYHGTETNTLGFDTIDCAIYKEVNSQKIYYSFADKDFTVRGEDVSPWLIRTQTEGSETSSILDNLSGKTIIEGYTDYAFTEIPGSAIYVYATRQDGGIDIYTVK